MDFGSISLIDYKCPSCSGSSAWAFRDLAGARAHIEEGPRASYAGHGYGLWRAHQREDGRPVGLRGLVKRVGLDDPDIG